MADPEVIDRPAGDEMERHRRGQWLLLAGFLVLAAIVAGLAYWAWAQQARSITEQAERSVHAVAKLKAGQIGAWTAERHGDAELLSSNEPLSAEVANILSGRDVAASTARVRSYLADLQRAYDYVDVILVAPDGRELMRVPATAAHPLGPRVNALIDSALRSREVASSSLYLGPGGAARVVTVAPLLAPKPNDPPVASVVLHTDPSLFLYPFVQDWPLPSNSGETLLVERRGDRVVFLNELRHRKGTALKLSSPADDATLPAAMAVRGRTGIVEGEDYRGVPVMAAIAPVPDTGWYVIAKVDRSEVLDPIHRRGWLTAGFTLLIVVLAAVGTILLWRLRERQVDAALVEGEERFRTLFENMTEGVALHELVVDAQGAPLDYRILDLNAAYERQTGVKADQVRGKLSRDAYETAEPPFLTEYAHTAQSGEALRFQTYFEPLARHFDITAVAQGGGRFATVFEDITERKRSEDALKRNAAMSEAVKLAQERFFTAEDPFETFDDLLDALLRLTGSEYGFIDELAYSADGQPELTARAITNIAWNDETRAIYPGFLTGELRFTNLKSLWGTVITTGKPVVANDAPHDSRRSRIPSGHPALNAFLGLPLRAGEELVGVIGLANAPGGYNEQTIAFLAPVVQGCANLIAAARGELRRRQAEQALRDSQHLLTEAEKLGRVGGWEYDIDTQLQTWTETVYDIHEVEFTSQPTVDQGEDFYTPASRPIIERAVQRAIEQDEPFDVELEIITAKGNLRSVHAIGEADPARRKVVGFFQDITEPKRAEQELRASERKFRETVESLDEGYYSVTIDGVVLDHNPAFCTVLGIDEGADLRGRHVPDFWATSGDRDAYVAELLAHGRIRDFLAEAKRADGTRLVVLLGAHLVIDEQGGERHIEGTVVDFTSRKAAEDEVARLNAELEQRVADRTAELDGANKELEAFAYSVSHDLRAPLRHISGFSSLLAEREGAQLDEKSRHYVEVISTSVRQMGDLIDDLLQFSRTGRAELHLAPVDMDATLAEALEPLRREADGRDIEWSVGPLPAVVADRALLRQVWTNLVGNAVKYTRGRSPARIEVGAAGVNGEVVFFVRDNGVGFDMQYVHKLFGVFQRLHNDTEFEGTGIGLANVKRIVTRLGGAVWAESEPGQGATFYFSLPDRKETTS